MRLGGNREMHIENTDKRIKLHEQRRNEIE